MKSKEFIREGDTVTGDFGAKGGDKPQTQNAKEISMAQAFGSGGYNILANAGIKLQEKPSYWSDLDRTAIGEVGLARVKKLFKEAGVPLPDVEAWEVFPIEPNGSTYVKGPLATIENVPTRGVFVIRDLPYSDDRRNADIKYGDFLVDSQGASSYIRFWRKID